MSSSPPPSDDMRAFLIVLRQALLAIVVWIEHRYQLKRSVDVTDHWR